MSVAINSSSTVKLKTLQAHVCKISRFPKFLVLITLPSETINF